MFDFGFWVMRCRHACKDECTTKYYKIEEAMTSMSRLNVKCYATKGTIIFIYHLKIIRWRWERISDGIVGMFLNRIFRDRRRVTREKVKLIFSQNSLMLFLIHPFFFRFYRVQQFAKYRRKAMPCHALNHFSKQLSTPKALYESTTTKFERNIMQHESILSNIEHNPIKLFTLLSNCIYTASATLKFYTK